MTEADRYSFIREALGAILAAELERVGHARIAAQDLDDLRGYRTAIARAAFEVGDAMMREADRRYDLRTAQLKEAPRPAPTSVPSSGVVRSSP